MGRSCLAARLALCRSRRSQKSSNRKVIPGAGVGVVDDGATPSTRTAGGGGERQRENGLHEEHCARREA